MMLNKNNPFYLRNKHLLLLIIFFLSCTKVFSQKDSLDVFSTQQLWQKIEYIGDFNDQNIYLLNALEKRKDLSKDKLHQLFTKRVYYHLYRGDYEKAKNYQLSNIAYYDRKNEYVDMVGSRYGMFLITLKQGDLLEAKKNFNEALIILDKLPETPMKYAVKCDLDQFYSLSGNYLDFAKYHTETYQKFSDLVEKSNIKPALIPKYEGVKIDMLIDISNNYLYAKKRDSAEKYINKAKEIEKKVIKITHSPLEETASLLLCEAQFFSVDGNTKKAIFLLMKAKKIAENTGNKEQIYICLTNLSLNYYLEEKYKESLEYAEKALQHKVSLNEQYFDYEGMAYELAGKSSLQLGMQDKAIHYSALFGGKRKMDNKIEKQRLFEELYAAQKIIPIEKELEKQKATKNLIISAVCVLFVGFISFFFFQRKRNRDKHEKFQEIIERLRNAKADEKVIYNKPLPKISDEKIKIILKQLHTFEQGKLYLKPNMSLAFLASHLNTNVNSLSHTINRFKNQNFNDYINGLRIDYIIEKLQNDKNYLNFKISYLSEECGFSSHSLFSSAFKKKLNISPSNFIEFLKKESSDTKIHQ